MPTTELSQHTSRRFDAELERARADLLAMGGLVERQLERSIQALLDGDASAAKVLAETDAEVNRMEVEIDQECLRVLATRTPAARDLRFIVAIIKSLTDLERIGDESEKIGYIAANLAGMDPPVSRYREIKHLGRLVQEMVRGALDAFARLDADTAANVCRRDRIVDEEYEAIQRQCITFMLEDPRSIRRALELMWVVRALERVGDHAKNLCEQVIYVVHGKDVRHRRLDELPSPLQR